MRFLIAILMLGLTGCASQDSRLVPFLLDEVQAKKEQLQLLANQATQEIQKLQAQCPAAQKKAPAKEEPKKEPKK